MARVSRDLPTSRSERAQGSIWDDESRSPGAVSFSSWPRQPEALIRRALALDTLPGPGFRGLSSGVKMLRGPIIVTDNHVLHEGDVIEVPSDHGRQLVEDGSATLVRRRFASAHE